MKHRVSRRQFLRSAALVAPVAALASSTASRAPAPQSAGPAATPAVPFYAFPTVPLIEGNEQYPRRDEPSLERLQDGRWLFVYANHVGTRDNDHTHLWAQMLDAAGVPLGDERIIIRAPENILNALSPALRRLPDRRLGLVFSYRESTKVASRRFATSDDEGRTWSEPVLVAGATEDGSYKTGRHDSFLVHSSGRLLVPCHCTDDWDKHHLWVQVARSDDLGRTWSLSGKIELPYVRWQDRSSKRPRPNMESGCIEPYACERADGSVLMTIRTAMGTQFFAESSDRGATWTPPASLEVTSSVAPASLMRVPNSDHLLLVWSQQFNAMEDNLGIRKNITAGISTDGGRSFPRARRKTLIQEAPRSVDYPFIRFVGKEVWVVYRDHAASTVFKGMVSTRLMRVPLAWLYA